MLTRLRTPLVPSAICRLLAAAAVAVIALSGQPAAAQTALVDNLNGPYGGPTGLFQATSVGQAFRTGASSHTLHSVVVPLEFLSSATPSNIVGELYGANGDGTVGSLQATLGGAAAEGAGLYRLSGNNAALAALTTYWLVLRNPGSPDFAFWSYTSSTNYSGDGTLPATLSGALKADNSSPWSYFPQLAGPQMLQVNVNPEATPEPGALMLMLPALAAVGPSLRRQSNRR